MESAVSASPAPTGVHGKSKSTPAPFLTGVHGKSKSTPAPFLTPDKRASRGHRNRASATAPQTPSGVASSGQPSSSYRGKRLGLDSSPPSSSSAAASSPASSAAASSSSAASAASQTCACTTGHLHLHLRGTGWGQAVEAACSYCGLLDDAARGDGAGARLLGQWYACAHVLVPGEGGGEQTSCVRAGGCGLSCMDLTGTFARNGSGRGGAKVGAGAGAGGSAGASGHRSTHRSKRGRRGDGGGGAADAKGAEGAEGGGASAAKKHRASTTTATTAPVASTKEEDGIAAWAAQRQHRLSRISPAPNSLPGTSTASVASAILGIDDILGKR